jgi:hypothetical protein
MGETIGSGSGADAIMIGNFSQLRMIRIPLANAFEYDKYSQTLSHM